jgi:hypothetical protein
MNIEELTIKEARSLIALFGAGSPANENPFRIGGNYFIRTVTHHLTGKLVEVTNTELVLEHAAWIADDGRFSDALKNCEFNEVEPFPDGRVIVGRGSLVDACEINTIPMSQK